MAIACPKCAFENPFGAPVCAECATPLAIPCPRCSFENPASWKFCGKCGSRLQPNTSRISNTRALGKHPSSIPNPLAEKIRDAKGQLEGERRTVTILFADVVGFTTISEVRDPEEVYSIIDQCSAAFRDEIARHEGWLDKFIGDGVMALFGAPIAHEDDPARAVRCALGMQDALARMNTELMPRLGIKLQLRIGLHSGTVVVGDVGSDFMNYTALGDAVNVASRLQTTAEPGSILASRAVREATLPLFEFKEVGNVRVKGRVEAVELYEVVGERYQPGRVRGIPGLSAPLVGRDKEFARVAQSLDDLRSADSGSVVLLTGDAGIGKSRLVAELKDYAQAHGVDVVQAACAAYGQPAYGVFIELLSSLFDIRDDDDQSARRGKLETATRTILPLEKARSQVTPYLEHLLGLSTAQSELGQSISYLEPAQLRQRTFLAVSDLLMAKAHRAPLLVILEDLHWLDQVSQSLLVFLFNVIQKSPLCLLLNSRQADNDIASEIQSSAIAALGAAFVYLHLNPLSESESLKLIDSLLSTAKLSAEISGEISKRTEGNPFFLEEMLRMMIDRHLLQRSADSWGLAGAIAVSTLQVPTTLQSLISARIDDLTESARHKLQCAAVIGRDFAFELLQSVTETNSSRLESDLQELLERELISASPDSAAGRYRFRHVLTQQTVYHQLLQRRRELIHLRVANAIEDLYADNLEEYVESIAYHYSEGQDGVAALPYLIRSGERAAARYANEQALTYFKDALDHATGSNATIDQRILIFAGMGDLQNSLGDYEAADASLRTALELARTIPGRARRIAEIARRLGRVSERRGELREAMRWLDTALYDLNRDPGSADAVERVRVYSDLGWLHYRLGQPEQAQDWQLRSLQVADDHPYYPEVAAAHNRLAAIHIDKGEWAEAIENGSKSLKLRTLIGDIDGVGRSQMTLGAIDAYRGEWKGALDHFRQAVEINERLHQPRGLANAYGNLGNVYSMMGDVDTAAEYLRAGLKVAEKIGDPQQICQALNGLAEVELLDENWQAAIEHLHTSLKLASDAGAKEDEAQAWCILSDAELAGGHTEQAEQAARESLGISQATAIRQIEASAHRALGIVERVQGRWHAAESELKKSIEISAELKNSFERGRAELELAVLFGDVGRKLESEELLRHSLDTFSELGVERYRQRAAQALSRQTDGATA